MPLSEKPLLSEETIRSRVAELADRISDDYAGRSLTVVVVLKGAIFFAADLVRELRVPVVVDFIRARSYEGTSSTGSVTITTEPESPLAGKDVLLVEDIVDTGRTTAVLLERIQRQAPASLALCSLLHKPDRCVVPTTIDYLGFTIDDRFVVGYGLDHEQRHRELRALHVLEP